VRAAIVRAIAMRATIDADNHNEGNHGGIAPTKVIFDSICCFAIFLFFFHHSPFTIHHSFKHPRRIVLHTLVSLNIIIILKLVDADFSAVVLPV